MSDSAGVASSAGQLGVGEVGGEMAGAAGTAPAPPGAGALPIGEVAPAEAGSVKFKPGVTAARGADLGVGEVYTPGAAIQAEPGKPGVPFNQLPMEVGESADTARSVAIQPGMPPAGAINVAPVEMPTDTPRGVVPQQGMPPPGAIKVAAVEMPAGTPAQVDLQQAGRTVVAGQLTLKDVLERNTGITEVSLQQVAPTQKGGALRSLATMARGALLQRLQGGAASLD